jgi:hypothetical protein
VGKRVKEGDNVTYKGDAYVVEKVEGHAKGRSP